MTASERKQSELRWSQWRADDLFDRLIPLPLEIRAYLAEQVWEVPVSSSAILYEQMNIGRLIGFNDE